MMDLTQYPAQDQTNGKSTDDVAMSLLAGDDSEEGQGTMADRHVREHNTDDLLNQLLTLQIASLTKAPEPTVVKYENPKRRDWPMWSLAFAIVIYAVSQLMSGVSWGTAQSLRNDALSKEVYDLQLENRTLRSYESHLRDTLFRSGLIKPEQLPDLPEVPTGDRH